MKTKWTNLQDHGPPDKEGMYICFFSDGTMETMSYDGPGFEDPWWQGVAPMATRPDLIITHWHELPEPPA